MFNVVDQHLQCFAVDRLNNVRTGLVQLQYPLENFLLLHQIAGVDGAEFVTIKRQCWQRLQVVLLVNAFVGCLHKVNVLLLALIVDVLQLVEDLLCLFVTLAVLLLAFDIQTLLLS